MLGSQNKSSTLYAFIPVVDLEYSQEDVLPFVYHLDKSCGYIDTWEPNFFYHKHRKLIS